MQEREGLVARTPANVNYQFRLAVLLDVMGDALIGVGNCSEGVAAYQRAQALLEGVAGKIGNAKTKTEIDAKLRRRTCR